MGKLEVLFIDGKIVAKTAAEWVEYYKEDSARIPSDQAVDALVRARRAAPNNAFVKSCAKYLERNGYLTQKQIDKLDEIEPVSFRPNREVRSGGRQMGRTFASTQPTEPVNDQFIRVGMFTIDEDNYRQILVASLGGRPMYVKEQGRTEWLPVYPADSLDLLAVPSHRIRRIDSRWVYPL